MQTYSALIRLSGSRDNEVRQSGLTAPEMHMLEYIHGPDSVGDVQPLGEIECDMTEERQRLVLVYGLDEDTPRVHKVFGVAGALPTEYKGIVFQDPKPAPRRKTSAFGRKPKQPDAVDKAAEATQASALEMMD